MDISQEFAALNGRFAETVNSHDTVGWVAMFADDAILVPAGYAVVSGRKGIEEWAAMATKVWNSLEIQQGLCTSDGNVAWESGSWTGNINVSEERTMDVGGNFLLIAQKDGSALRIKAHSWSMNPTTP